MTQPGRCHFNPPVAPRVEAGTATVWPATAPDDWCGQYTAATATVVTATA